MAPAELVHLLDADPDLAAGVEAADRPVARAALVCATERIRVGDWSPIHDGEQYGALVLEGLLLREKSLAGRPSAELLGTGDILLPLGADAVTFIPRHVRWRAIAPVRVAWLGSPLLAAFVRWPAIARTVLQRSERRVARVMAMQSLAHLPRVEDRVLGVLWLLAERWGRVCADGVRLPLPLTQRALGQLIGAQRPSVTGAIGVLEERGELRRLAGGGWLLVGEPAAFLRADDGAPGRMLDGVPPSGAVG